MSLISSANGHLYRSLLVPLDGSLFAEQALTPAVSIARRAGASLRLVVVAACPTFPFPSFKAVSDYRAKTWHDYLERVVRRVRSHGDVPVSSVLLEGEDIAHEIAAHSEGIGADLIVMTTHGRGALGRFWFGSVPHELMQCSSRPLLLVRPGDSLIGWANESVPRHVLVPLDGSPLAERMIEPAMTLGSLMGADYILLRVVNDLPFGTPELDSISLSSASLGLLDEIRSVQERVQKDARDYLDGVAEPLRARGLRIQTRVTVANDPGTAILHEAGGTDIDLVALETHGRGGLSGMVAGSVARKVIYGTPKLVLVQSSSAHQHTRRLESFGEGTTTRFQGGGFGCSLRPVCQFRGFMVVVHS